MVRDRILDHTGGKTIRKYRLAKKIEMKKKLNSAVGYITDYQGNAISGFFFGIVM